MAARRQVVRWTFVLHGYDANTDYIAYLSHERHGIKRVIFGFEVSLQGSEHLQVRILINYDV